MIADGSDLRVFFIDTAGFETGDRQVLFLRWTRMWLSDGTPTSLRRRGALVAHDG
jgi:hypothetical protein